MNGLVWLVWSVKATGHGAAVLCPASYCLDAARALWELGGVWGISVEEQGSRPSTGWTWRATSVPRVARAVLP